MIGNVVLLLRRKGKGGLIIGKRKEWGKTSSKLIQREEEGIILSRIEVEEEIICVVSVYNTVGWRSLEDGINKLVEGREADNIIVGGGGL